MPWIYLTIAIVGEVIGTTALKATEGFTRLGPSIATVAAYGTAFFFLGLTLKTIPVGIAYAIWAGAGIVLIALIGLIAFGQTLDWAAIIGIGLILAGVIIINTLSGSVSH